jgi:3',5'-cyclic AMP phosphodiesterase CpdA
MEWNRAGTGMAGDAAPVRRFERPPMLRRDVLALAAAGGSLVCASALPGCASDRSMRDFTFVQLSDSHWGFSGPPNPDAGGTLKKAVDAVNALAVAPDFVVFTGDLTHTTDDPVERRRRLAEFKSIVSALRVKDVHFMPGEHDASLDAGAAFSEFFGPTHYVFDHGGVHFVVVDNVSDPGARIGEAQLAWLRDDLAGRDPDAPLVVFTHRPLFDLEPKWDWATRDGAQAIALLKPFKRATVFYGHIHQENHRTIDGTGHHAAKSLIFALPAPGSQANRTPLPWNPARPYAGLGFRDVALGVAEPAPRLTELPVVAA